MTSFFSGTFVQVTFFEILAPEFAERHANQLHKMAAVILGFLIISLTMYLLHDIPVVDFCKVWTIWCSEAAFRCAMDDNVDTGQFQQRQYMSFVWFYNIDCECAKAWDI